MAYSGLSSAQQNQTILVSGESGAGKTETVKIVMTNLATLEHTRALYPFTNDALKSWDRKREEGAQGIIVRRVLESNPLFEAFSNAKVSVVRCINLIHWNTIIFYISTLFNVNELKDMQKS